jgi:hypothetical protein
MSVGSVSFWRQNQSWSAGQASATSNFFGGSKIFASSAYGNSIENSITAAANAMNALGSATTSYYMDAAILAAKQGKDRIDKAAAAKNDNGLNKPVGDISTQVSFSGSLAGLVDFYANSASTSKFQFLTGTSLINTFNTAMQGLTSQGDAINAVTVSGNTLTASTSGVDAHPVFTLTLNQNSGTWTFKPINPIDQQSNNPKTFDLSSLVQEIKTDTQTSTLSNSPLSAKIKITVSSNDQSTISGALSDATNSGVLDPSVSGRFQFVSGSKLKNAFKLAMTAEKSNGDAIDTVSVIGNTLTASTSGPEAHPVFTITLHPDSGLWTFKLLNPLNGTPDQTTKFVTSLDLSGLMQGVKSTGETMALSSSIMVNIYGDLGSASKTTSGGSVHQGGLVYTPPAKIVTPVTVMHQMPYIPPINPATGYRYVTASSISSTGTGVNVIA